jgi:histidinol-phosphatase (PHP family)
MGRAIDLGVFQSICHPDLLLRSGVNGGLALKSFEEVINQMKKANVCYEINCSGLSKSRYSQKSKKMISRGYLDRDLLLYGHSTGIKFTIGSDCHSPAELGKGVDDMLDFAAVHNLNINYFRDGERTEFLMKKSAPKVETKTS